MTDGWLALFCSPFLTVTSGISTPRWQHQDKMGVGLRIQPFSWKVCSGTSDWLTETLTRGRFWWMWSIELLLSTFRTVSWAELKGLASVFMFTFLCEAEFLTNLDFLYLGTLLSRWFRFNSHGAKTFPLCSVSLHQVLFLSSLSLSSELQPWLSVQL